MIKHIALALTLAIAPLSSFASQFVEGKHYNVISQKAPSSQPKLTEFFSFYCHNCFGMETMYMSDIKSGLNKQVAFETKHINFSRDQNDVMPIEVMRALSVIHQIGGNDKINHAMFAAIQGEEGAAGHDHSAPGHTHEPTVNNRDDIKKIFAKFGIDGTKYDALATNAITEEKIALWLKQQREFRIQSVPAFIVNDKYAIDMTQLRTIGQLVDLINYLALDKNN